MDELIVDYANLKNKAERLRELYVEASEQIGVIADFSADLDIFWDGEANTTFVTCLTEDIAEISGVMIRLRETISAIFKALELYMQNEKEIKNMIGELL